MPIALIGGVLVAVSSPVSLSSLVAAGVAVRLPLLASLKAE